MTSYAEQIKHRGYSELPVIKRPSKELLSLSSLITPLLKENTEIKKMSKKEVLYYSRSFLLKYFNLHNVPYEKEINLIPFSIELSSSIHPFKLPVKTISDTDLFYGCSHEVLIFNTKANACSSLKYRWIELSKDLTELASLAYTHEITHTQLNHLPDSIHDYNNIEFLSIFLELVEASESLNKDLMRIHDYYRLRELKEIITELDQYHDTTNPEIHDILLEGTSYLHSTLKAYHLFYKYIEGDINLRRTIMVGVQRVFNHLMSVEDLLAYFNITYENSIDKELFKSHLRGI